MTTPSPETPQPPAARTRRPHAASTRTTPRRRRPSDLLGTAVAETAAGVTGVHHLGGLAARTLDRARRQVLGTSGTPGSPCRRSPGDHDRPRHRRRVPAPARCAVVENVRAQVARAARQIVDGPVAVDIVVTDVHGPFDPDPAVLDAVEAMKGVRAEPHPEATDARG